MQKLRKKVVFFQLFDIMILAVIFRRDSTNFNVDAVSSQIQFCWDFLEKQLLIISIDIYVFVLSDKHRLGRLNFERRDDSCSKFLQMKSRPLEEKELFSLFSAFLPQQL